MNTWRNCGNSLFKAHSHTHTQMQCDLHRCHCICTTLTQSFTHQIQHLRQTINTWADILWHAAPGRNFIRNNNNSRKKQWSLGQNGNCPLDPTVRVTTYHPCLSSHHTYTHTQTQFTLSVEKGRYPKLGIVECVRVRLCLTDHNVFLWDSSGILPHLRILTQQPSPAVLEPLTSWSEVNRSILGADHTPGTNYVCVSSEHTTVTKVNQRMRAMRVGVTGSDVVMNSNAHRVIGWVGTVCIFILDVLQRDTEKRIRPSHEHTTTAPVTGSFLCGWFTLLQFTNTHKI